MGPHPTFRIVPSRGAFDVLGMRDRETGHTLADAKRPGEPGWLGNPYKAVEVGGSYTRQKATELFWRDLKEKIDADPEWRQAVLDLRGKAVGYYKPGEEYIHLHPLQQWLSEQPAAQRRIRNGIIEQLEPDDVFVFGSNLRGIHGAGAARTARERFGAIPGQGEGLMGQSYALPTKAAPYQGRDPADIAASFQKLYDTARANPDRNFYLTRVGQGLAGMDEAGVRALMGEEIPGNVRPWWTWEGGEQPAAQRRLLIDSSASGLGQAVSPFYARLPSGLSVEQAYQQAKGYPDWRAGKGKPAVDPAFDYEGTYQNLYQEFADANPELIDQLEKEIEAGAVLEHPRARTTQNPATALTRIIEARRGARSGDQTQLELALDAVTPPVEDGPVAGKPAAQQLAGRRWPAILAIAAGVTAAGGAAYGLTRESEPEAWR